MVRETSSTAIADQQPSTVHVSEQLPQLDAVTFPIRPGGCAVNWVRWDEHTLHVAFDPKWFDAEQAVAVVRLITGRRITLVQAVTR